MKIANCSPANLPLTTQSWRQVLQSGKTIFLSHSSLCLFHFQKNRFYLLLLLSLLHLVGLHLDLLRPPPFLPFPLLHPLLLHVHPAGMRLGTGDRQQEMFLPDFWVLETRWRVRGEVAADWYLDKHLAKTVGL